MDALQDGVDPRSRRLDPRGDGVVAAGRVVVAAGGAERIGEAELRALLGDADEPGVVAADPDGYKPRLPAQRVELRRVGAAERQAGLRFGHVPGLGAAAAHVDVGRDAEVGRDQRRVVVVGARAIDRVTVLVRHQRRRRVGVAERYVGATRRRRRSRRDQREHPRDQERRQRGERPHSPSLHFPCLRCRPAVPTGAAPGLPTAILAARSSERNPHCRLLRRPGPGGRPRLRRAAPSARRCGAARRGSRW